MEIVFNSKDKQKPKIIVILFKAGIGNMLLFLPALKLLRKNFAQAKLILICAPRGVEEIIQRLGMIDEIRIHSQSKITEVLKLGWNLRKEKVDCVISAQPGITGSLIGFLSRARQRIGFRYCMGLIDNSDFLYTNAVFYDRTKHEVKRYLDLIKTLNFPIVQACKQKPYDLSINLNLKEADYKNAQKILLENSISSVDFLIGIHPGSFQDQKFKRWPIEHWRELCKLLVRHYQAKVLILGGAEEQKIGNEIEEKIEKIINLTGKTALMETAGIIQKCKFFVSNDSGLMHLSVAVETPVFGIFGPTSPVKNRPWTKKGWVIQLGLGCQPCYQEFRDWKGCKYKRVRCLKELSAEKVFEFINNNLPTEVG